METIFKNVHTTKDLTISGIVFIAGICLLFINAGLGVFFTIMGVAMLCMFRKGYKKNGQGTMLTRQSEEICMECKASLIDFLNGKDVKPEIKKGNCGGTIRLDAYFNKAEGLAYVQLFEYRNYTYESLTEVVELHSPKAEIIVSQL